MKEVLGDLLSQIHRHAAVAQYITRMMLGACIPYVIAKRTKGKTDPDDQKYMPHLMRWLGTIGLGPGGSASKH